MITTKYGIVKASGSRTELEADLICIIHALDVSFTEKYDAEEAEKTIRRLVDASFEKDVRDMKESDIANCSEYIGEAIEALEKLRNLSEKFDRRQK